MRPSARLLLSLALLLVPLAIWPDYSGWSVLLGLIGAIWSIDLVLALRVGKIDVDRKLAPNLAVNRGSSVLLQLRANASRPLRCWVQDEVPQGVRTLGLPHQTTLPVDTLVQFEYELTPSRRGDGHFGAVSLNIDSPFGFWQVRQRVAQPQTVRIYPDFGVIQQYLELVSEQHAYRLGLKKRQRRGEGREFHQLRDFREGDSLRQVDWKATARRRELISREYAEERDQRVLFLMDTGTRMRARDASLSHFDHALNAMLLLSYVALRQGDTVALKAFGPSPAWLPELRGVGAVNHLLNSVYALRSAPSASDYIAAAEELMQQQRKRSLVVLMTNLREEDQDLLPALQLLRRRHVVLLANLKETVVDENLDRPLRSLEDAFAIAGAYRYQSLREEAQRKLHKATDVLIDTVPSRLPHELVNHYWMIKAAGLL